MKAARVHVWLAPAAIFIVSVIGLVVAPVADGWGDVVSVALLAMPAAVCVWMGYLKRQRASAGQQGTE